MCACKPGLFACTIISFVRVRLRLTIYVITSSEFVIFYSKLSDTYSGAIPMLHNVKVESLKMEQPVYNHANAIDIRYVST